MKFTELDLPQPILAALEKMGFEELTPIQEMTYPIIFAGKDLCALAETGSGKTAACAIPLIQQVDTSHNAIQGIVVVPTRELCIQYVDEIQKIAQQTKVVPFAVYGGFSKGIQTAKINHEVHLLVATPGRLLDLLYDGTIDLSHVKCAILDEADELLKVGFLDDIKRIFSCMIHKHQTLMFSATMADDIKSLAHECLHDPEYVTLIQKRATPLSIEHSFIYCHPRDKQIKIIDYLGTEDVRQAIIFCNARHMVDKLARVLRDKFKGVEYIHAGIEQRVRSRIFTHFKREKIRYLIATDVAGRGLDFSHISHVINWDFPQGEQYAHRTGRAGRMGKKGIACTFVTRHDLSTLKDVIKHTKIVPQWIGKDPFQDKALLHSTKSRSPRQRPARGHKTRRGPRSR